MIERIQAQIKDARTLMHARYPGGFSEACIFMPITEFLAMCLHNHGVPGTYYGMPVHCDPMLKQLEIRVRFRGPDIHM